MESRKIHVESCRVSRFFIMGNPQGRWFDFRVERTYSFFFSLSLSPFPAPVIGKPFRRDKPKILEPPLGWDVEGEFHAAIIF